MSLNDDLVALESARRNVGGSACRISLILENLDDKDRAALEHLLDKTDVFGTQIAETLKRHGHMITGSNVQHHRRRVRGGGCSCPVPADNA